MDDRERLTCPGCGYVHYVGPVLAAGAILHDGERICMVRRALRPGKGKWTFPGGFVNLGETPEQAALRETEEETGLGATLEGLLGAWGSRGPRDKEVVILVYVARATGEAPRVASEVEEVEEVRWFARDELPWDAFAFESTARALRAFLGEGPHRA